jgi:hypothetical protein
VLNAGAEEGAASLLWPVIRETFGRGEAACRPRIAARGLSDTFVDPAIELLRREGAELRFRSRLRAIDVEGDRVVALRFTGAERVPIASGDRVVLAVPPAAVAALLPGVTVPYGSRAIVNGHFLLDRAAERPSFLGLVGGLCQWLFIRGDVASITVSAADGLAEVPADEIARRMWKEVAIALGPPERSLPAFRIVKEKRATFAQVPAEIARRPRPPTAICNLFLAGDWTDTGLPATIEGSLRSGERAHEAVLGSVSRP